MGSRKKKTVSTLSEIKQKLDPAFSYIVFEKTLVSGESSSFRKIINFLSRFKKNLISYEDYSDKDGRHLLLVVKLAPIELEYISQEIVNIADPEDFSFIIYDSRSDERVEKK
jgi:hypothetical protein